MHPFVRGVTYQRETLLDFLGSQQTQSGVLWGKAEPGCLICTSGGRHGKKAGYSDEATDDGGWWYFGQGQNGNQSLANPANRKLASLERSVLLFSSREPTAIERREGQGYSKILTFEGCFNVVGFEHVTPTNGPREGDSLIRFRLFPADSEGTLPLNIPAAAQGPVDLRALQIELSQATLKYPDVVLGVKEYRRRSAAVHAYALSRAKGVCEGCMTKAPFHDLRGRPFLEVHHLTRLADEGPDSGGNVAAICPNCHRRAHCSNDRLEFNTAIKTYVENRELEIATEGGNNFEPML